ncbi:MAG: hypothetical protein EOP09_03545 [Proteobacteria bacterium]|nr:MAG: hypothetical protein EOP09_03545 [Pseudomonadota bacterium]
MSRAAVSEAEKHIAKTRSELEALTKDAWILGREIRHAVRAGKGRQLDHDTRWLMGKLDQLQTKLAAFASRAYHHDRAALTTLQSIAAALRENEDT